MRCRPRQRQRALELALEEVDLRAGELIERSQVLVARDARVGDQQNPVLHVVEREHRIEQHEAGRVATAVAGVGGRATAGSNHAAVS